MPLDASDGLEEHPLVYDCVVEGGFCPLRSEPGVLMLILQLAGGSILTQDTCTRSLGPGDLVLLDPSTPTVVSASGSTGPPGPSRQLRMRLADAASLPPPGPTGHGVGHGVRGRLPIIAGTTAIGAALGNLLIAVHSVATAPQRFERRAIAAAVNNLLQAAAVCGWGAVGHPIEPSGRMISLLYDSIEQSLSDPGLCPASIAARHGISVRHLHRLFHDAGLSFGTFVRRRRLERALGDLLDPRLRDVPVTEIAFRWGFSDSAHFSRCFRAAFGCTARGMRSGRAAPHPD